MCAFNFAFNDLLEFVNLQEHIFIATCLFTTIMILLFHFFITKPSNKVFLIDFVCYKPPVTLKCTRKETVHRAKRALKKVSEETLEFMKKTMDRGGIGDSTYLPMVFGTDPLIVSMEEARGESEMVMFGVIDELLEKTGVKSVDIGILVVNCCLFNVVPSLTSMIVNKYKLRNNVVSYNLSGMGCSAGLGAIGLAKQLLQVHRNCYALVVSTENISDNCYMGNDRSKVLINCFFRIGGAAILLSNLPSDQFSSKYQLIHTVHTHTASSDLSYNAIIQEEDIQDGYLGVTITKDLMAAAISAIEPNVSTLGPLVLPVSEQFYYLVNHIVRYLHVAKIKPYVPNFKRAFDHFFAHVGGKPVLDELQRNLGMSKDDMEASRMTLYRFGNTSSSSVWYELAYAEAKGRVKRGDRVWQIAFGSGFKCSSAIWRSMRTVDREEMNPWRDEIDGFPVNMGNSEAVLPYYFEPSKKGKLNQSKIN